MNFNINNNLPSKSKSIHENGDNKQFLNKFESKHNLPRKSESIYENVDNKNF